MKILFLSPHAFLPSTRKTSVHFVSEALADRGHSVATISVGYSLLTRFKNPSLFRLLVAEQKNRFVEKSSNYRSACYVPLLHPFSSKTPLFARAMALFFRLYGSVLPRFIENEAKAADIMVLESGTSICFFEAIRRVNKTARIVYFRRDRLDSVGASRYLVDVEQRLGPAFDCVMVPSPSLAEHLPAGTKVKYVPQGIDKRGFDQCQTSPYPAGSRNAISVGNMLFDDAAVTAMARHNPGVSFHLFGSGIAGDFPSNVKVYGERPFEEIIPFIKFADFGLAPYRLTEKELYIAASSLKLQQYSYCLLPILVPELLAGTRDNLITYRQTGEHDWANIVERALAAKKDPAWRSGIVSWQDVAAQVEADFFARTLGLEPNPSNASGEHLELQATLQA
jgi:2-beta-glucuronyltransferase